jgi:DNA (cytosine-5)-methyltransferase 1
MPSHNSYHYYSRFLRCLKKNLEKKVEKQKKKNGIQTRKGRKLIVWPQITHMDGGENLLGYQRWRPAKEIIDWSIPGTSIFDRKRPLAAATLRRIAAGIEKYWKGYAEPFLAVLYGTNDVRSLDLPLPTVTASGHHHALIEPFITRYQGDHGGQQDSENRNHGLERPLPTVDTSNRYALIQPFVTAIGQSSAKDRSRSIDEPISTVVGKQEHCLVEPLLVEYHGTSKPYPVSLPVKTITTKDRFALLEPFLLKVNHTGGDRIQSINDPHGTLTTKRDTAICQPLYNMDIRFRMLKNHELAKAQGFPDDYKITGNVTEQTKQIGNAVPVNTAKALALAAMGA